MAKTNNSKMKLLYLMKIFLEETDENHPLSMPQILDKLLSYGIKTERKSVYSDIELLTLFGIDIIGEKRNTFCYYVASRSFETAELKLLADCVQSSKFLTEKKSLGLIKKIEGLTSRYEAAKLRRQVHVMGRVKTMDETILYSVDTLNSAISENKKLAFKYCEYTPDKNKVFKNEGKDYIVSPYYLVMSEDNYYLLAHYPKHEGLTHFRVDRIASIKMLDEKSEEIENILGKDFDITSYCKKVFGMFSGEAQTVTLSCKNSLMGAVIDRFGKDITVKKCQKEHFEVDVNVNISPVFFAWVFTFEGDMKIISPKNVVKKFNKTLKKFKD